MIKNYIAAGFVSVVFAIVYQVVYAPPDWAVQGASVLMAVTLYLHYSLVDMIREHEVTNVE